MWDGVNVFLKAIAIIRKVSVRNRRICRVCLLRNSLEIVENAKELKNMIREFEV